jgi:hypothetical protein
MPVCYCGRKDKKGGHMMRQITKIGHPAWRKLARYQCQECGRIVSEGKK